MNKITSLYGKLLLLLGILYLSYTLIFKITSAEDTILYFPNLIFHEAGHTIFRFFGSFMHIFGGSFLQVLIPLIVMLQFLRQGDPFSSSVGLWWAGQNILEVAIYVGDAKEQNLMLLGGGTGQDRPGSHDWNNLLARFDLLDFARPLENMLHVLGSFIMLAAIAWGLFSLYKTHWEQPKPLMAHSHKRKRKVR